MHTTVSAKAVKRFTATPVDFDYRETETQERGNAQAAGIHRPGETSRSFDTRGFEGTKGPGQREGKVRLRWPDELRPSPGTEKTGQLSIGRI